MTRGWCRLGCYDDFGVSIPTPRKTLRCQTPLWSTNLPRDMSQLERHSERSNTESDITYIQTFFLNLPRMWASRLEPSKHNASRRPLPSILRTWAYSGWTLAIVGEDIMSGGSRRVRNAVRRNVGDGGGSWQYWDFGTHLGLPLWTSIHVSRCRSRSFLDAYSYHPVESSVSIYISWLDTANVEARE